MARLRGAEGCAWDRAQDYDSMKGLLLEEVYEAVDAVNGRDFDALEDELGDLLFLILFYSRLAQEEKRFSVEEVIERVHAKLIRRHPHVFGDQQARTEKEALESWLRVKEKEKQANPDEREAQPASLLDEIPRSFPSTLEAYEIGVRAAEVGFDWPGVEDLLDKVEEEVREIRHEVKRPDAAGRQRVEGEVGDLLFAVSNLARFLKSDPESCLRRANRKFRKRFRALEQEATRQGRRVRECSAQELDAIWEQVKGREK